MRAVGCLPPLRAAYGYAHQDYKSFQLMRTKQSE